MDNIILIGMPGSGKSTIGVLLAKMMGYGFVDTDLLIQHFEGKKLYEILRDKGNDYFSEREMSKAGRYNTEKRRKNNCRSNQIGKAPSFDGAFPFEGFEEKGHIIGYNRQSRVAAP